jgi:hypothetical protein
MMPLSALAHLTSPMSALTVELDAITADIAEPARPPAVAAALSDYLGCANLFAPQHLTGSSAHYRANIVHVAPRRLYGRCPRVATGSTNPDPRSPKLVCGRRARRQRDRAHVSWSDFRLRERERRRYQVGATTGMTAGDDDIHDVTASTPTVSIHIYGLDYRTTTSSIRTTYAAPPGRGA